LFNSCSVESRHLAAPMEELLRLEGTGSRNSLYEKCAPQLAKEAALRAIEDWGGRVERISHVIAVSCTGTVVPWLEFLLVNSLGLRRSVQRSSLNFMGCFGALAALRSAQTIALADPTHRVLIVCCELCSLHIQKEELRFDNLVGSALFGDGAAALIVGGDPTPGVSDASRAEQQERPLFEIVRTSCYAIADSEDKIKWDLSDTGWRIGLSPDIPIVFKQVLPAFCQALIDGESKVDDCDWKELQWAIHPGGKAVVDIIEQSFALQKEQTDSTWKVLSEKGNMSSGTVLFILDDLRRKKGKRAIQECCVTCFWARSCNGRCFSQENLLIVQLFFFRHS